MSERERLVDLYCWALERVRIEGWTCHPSRLRELYELTGACLKRLEEIEIEERAENVSLEEIEIWKDLLERESSKKTA